MSEVREVAEMLIEARLELARTLRAKTSLEEELNSARSQLDALRARVIRMSEVMQGRRQRCSETTGSVRCEDAVGHENERPSHVGDGIMWG